MTELISEDQMLTEFAVREHRSLWLDAWRRLISNRTAMLGLVIVAIFLLTAIGAHFFWEYDPTVDLDYNAKLLAPTIVRSDQSEKIHLFGTDKLGRDIFRRVVHGGWNSLRVGIVAVGISLLIGGLLGLLSGFYESIEMVYWERVVLMALIGLALGALPAWIAMQAWQALLFAALGAASAFWPGWLMARPPLRLAAWSGMGLLLGGF